MSHYLVTYNLGNLADWLAAIGTISATGVAIWLARRDDCERLGVTLNVVSRQGSSELQIILMNKGTQPTIVVDAEFVIGRFGNPLDESIEMILAGRPLPLRLAPRTDDTLRVTLQNHPSYLPDRLAQAVEARSWWQDQRAYLRVTTATGAHRMVRIPRQLRPILVRRARSSEG